MQRFLRSLVKFALFACFGLFTVSTGFAQTFINTVVGAGGTYYANNIPASYAKLYNPTAVAVDLSGNYYFADSNPSAGYGAVIYKVTVSTGYISIVAGTGAGGYTGDGGPATSATFSNQVYGLTVAPSGNVYISDSSYSVIRKVTVSTGVIATYAGYNPNQTPYFGGYNGDGIGATSAYLNAPAGIYTTGSALYIADALNHRVRVVPASTGIISTVAGNGTGGYSGDGGLATSAELNNPSGVSLDSIGNIYISDLGVNQTASTVRRVLASTGDIYTYAGGAGDGYSPNGTPAGMSFLQVPHNLAIDSLNNVYIADSGAAVVSEVRAFDDDYYDIAGSGEGGFSGDGGPAASAKLSNPYGAAVDGSGNLYIADQLNARIREVTTVITPYIYTSTQGRYQVESSVTVSSLRCCKPRPATDQPGFLGLDWTKRLHLHVATDQ